MKSARREGIKILKKMNRLRDDETVRLATETAAGIFARKFAETLKPKITADTGDFKSMSSQDIVRGFTEAVIQGRVLPSGSHSAQVNLYMVSKRSAKKTLAETGYDTFGLVRSFSTDQLLHAIAGHGPEGQLPLSPEILSLYPEIVGNPDRVTVSKNVRGTISLKSYKRVNGVAIVVEEIRTGSSRRGSKTKGGVKELAFFTMWIEKAPTVPFAK